MEEHMFDELKEVPWNVGRSHTRDEDILVDIPGEEEGVAEIPSIEPRRPDRRIFQTTQQDLIEHGPTRGCSTCQGLMRGIRNVGEHNQVCRASFE